MAAMRVPEVYKYPHELALKPTCAAEILYYQDYLNLQEYCHPDPKESMRRRQVQKMRIERLLLMRLQRDSALKLRRKNLAKLYHGLQLHLSRLESRNVNPALFDDAAPANASDTVPANANA